MKTTHTFNVHFLIKKNAARKNGTVPVNARISVDGIKCEVSAQLTVQETHWNKEACRVNPKSRNAKNINDHLDTVYADIIKAKKQLVQEGQFLTAQTIRLRYLGKDKMVKTLKELIAYHKENDMKKLAKGTAKNYSATEKYLDRFLKKKFRSPDLHLAQIDYGFVVNFETYLSTCPPLRKSQPLGNNGIMKHLERLQKFTTLALKHGWIKKNPFALYSLKFEEYDCAFLEQQELDTLTNLEIPERGVKLARDVFIFACYTGLCYIEVKNLTIKSIVPGIDGEPWIMVRRQKSKTPVKVPLLDKAREILELYADYPCAENGFALLPVLSSQKVNKYLKMVAGLGKVGKNLTFHVARHTFATTITLLNAVPIVTVSKLLGHKKLTTTQRYARVVEKKISKDMAALKQKLKDNPPTPPEPSPHLSDGNDEHKYPHLRLVR